MVSLDQKKDVNILIFAANTAYKSQLVRLTQMMVVKKIMFDLCIVFTTATTSSTSATTDNELLSHEEQLAADKAKSIDNLSISCHTELREARYAVVACIPSLAYQGDLTLALGTVENIVCRVCYLNHQNKQQQNPVGARKRLTPNSVDLHDQLLKLLPDLYIGGYCGETMTENIEALKRTLQVLHEKKVEEKLDAYDRIKKTAADSSSRESNASVIMVTYQCGSKPHDEEEEEEKKRIDLLSEYKTSIMMMEKPPQQHLMLQILFTPSANRPSGLAEEKQIEEGKGNEEEEEEAVVTKKRLYQTAIETTMTTTTTSVAAVSQHPSPTILLQVTSLEADREFVVLSLHREEDDEDEEERNEWKITNVYIEKMP